LRLTAANTAIVLDSTADLPDAADRFPNWRVVPLYVRFGDESLRDGVDIDPTEFYARLRESSVFPTTSQPTPGDFLACYEELGAYERILSLHVSARVSGTFASAETAAAELASLEGRRGKAATNPGESAPHAEPGDGRVRVIDAETASASIAMLALAIQRRLARGTSDEEVDALVERYLCERGLLFTVDTLEFLQRGGRIGKAAAFAGALLQVKPILSIRGGEVEPVKRVRGERKAFAELAAALETETADEPGYRLSVAHAAAPERAAELEALVRERRPKAELELVVALGAVIGAHAGPGTLALFWFRDGD
jgi:DegV family protein with EDD domain